MSIGNKTGSYAANIDQLIDVSFHGDRATLLESHSRVALDLARLLTERVDNVDSIVTMRGTNHDLIPMTGIGAMVTNILTSMQPTTRPVRQRTVRVSVESGEFIPDFSDDDAVAVPGKNYSCSQYPPNYGISVLLGAQATGYCSAYRSEYLAAKSVHAGLAQLATRAYYCTVGAETSLRPGCAVTNDPIILHGGELFAPDSSTDLQQRRALTLMGFAA